MFQTCFFESTNFITPIHCNALSLKRYTSYFSNVCEPQEWLFNYWHSYKNQAINSLMKLDNFNFVSVWTFAIDVELRIYSHEFNKTIHVFLVSYLWNAGKVAIIDKYLRWQIYRACTDLEGVRPYPTLLKISNWNP